jgi:hypothetical protein
VWVLTRDDVTVRVRHSKGIADLAVLITRAGTDVHVRELEPVSRAAAPTAGTKQRGSTGGPLSPAPDHMYLRDRIYVGMYLARADA